MLYESVHIENRFYTKLFVCIQIENRLYEMLLDVIQIESLGVRDAFRFITLSKQELKNCSFVSKLLKMDPRTDKSIECMRKHNQCSGNYKRLGKMYASANFTQLSPKAGLGLGTIL